MTVEGTGKNCAGICAMDGMKICVFAKILPSGLVFCRLFSEEVWKNEKKEEYRRRQNRRNKKRDKGRRNRTR